MQFTKEKLTRIIESADEVITALAGTNDDIHPDNSTKMCAAWDDLNDHYAPPSVFKRLAELVLAGMAAEPVMYAKTTDGDFDEEAVSTNKAVVDAWADEWNESGVQKYGTVALYAAPQPATVVPDEIEPDDGNTFDYVDGWNACRAAMQSGSVKDGWLAVSGCRRQWSAYWLLENGSIMSLHSGMVMAGVISTMSHL